MRRLAMLALCALTAVIAGGCVKRAGESKPGPLPVAAYYPLAVGNRWTYQVKLLNEVSEQTVRIEREENGVFVDNQGGKLSVDGYGLTDRQRYLLREPIEAGKTWNNVVTVSSTERYQILQVGPSCEVPAGTFEGCVRVESRNRLNRRTTLVNELTFAPHVGIVRIRVIAETDGKQIPQTELALKSYEIKR